MRKKALICGVTGQDGAYLARYLLKKDYDVYGTSRNPENQLLNGLRYLKILDKLKILKLNPDNPNDVFNIVETIQPDEIYNLSGQSSVYRSFNEPRLTFDSIVIVALNFLEAIKKSKKNIKYYNAGSGECFGETSGNAVTEVSCLKPNSPYSVAKTTSHQLTETYRNVYGLHCSTGILFNHESPLRPANFVTQKIIKSVVDIKNNKSNFLELGNLNIERDWGWAEDYVDAMWKMLQLNMPEDFIIATGRSVSLKYFVEYAFSRVGLNWKDYVIIDDKLIRKNDAIKSYANPAKAKEKLKWEARHNIECIIEMMIDSIEN